MLSDEFYKLQRHVEDLSLKAYAATAEEASRGLYTIGYGHTRGVKPGDTITQEKAEEYLIEDAQDALSSSAPYLADLELTQHQLDAIVSMVFNLGPKLFKNRDGSDTGIYTALKAHDHKAVMGQMRRWTRQAGKVLTGLVTRRGMEEMLYLLGTIEGESECEYFIPAY